MPSRTDPDAYRPRTRAAAPDRTRSTARTGTPNDAWTAYVDGGAHPNPGGIMGIGVVLKDPGGRVRCEVGERLPERGTNNEAEFRAVLRAVEEAAARGAERLIVHADSRLTVNTLSGTWQIRAAHLQTWKQRIDATATRLDQVAYRWVPRDRNKEADRLATEAMGGSVGAGAKFGGTATTTSAGEEGQGAAGRAGTRAAAASVDEGDVACPRCGGAVALVWQTFRDGRRHIRMECGAHGFAGYAAKTEANQAAADRNA